MTTVGGYVEAGILPLILFKLLTAVFCLSISKITCKWFSNLQTKSCSKQFSLCNVSIMETHIVTELLINQKHILYDSLFMLK